MSDIPIFHGVPRQITWRKSTPAPPPQTSRQIAEDAALEGLQAEDRRRRLTDALLEERTSVEVHARRAALTGDMRALHLDRSGQIVAGASGVERAEEYRQRIEAIDAELARLR